jgi:hypothetical protein
MSLREDVSSKNLCTIACNPDVPPILRTADLLGTDANQDHTSRRVRLSQELRAEKLSGGRPSQSEQIPGRN